MRARHVITVTPSGAIQHSASAVLHVQSWHAIHICAQTPCEVPSGSPSRDKTHSGSVTETGEAPFKSRDFDVRPLLVIWEMTQACDLKCVHCRASAQPHGHALELSTVEAFNLVDQVANMRVPMFVLTGGDPLKRPDLQAIVQYARGRSVKTSLTPSATPLFTFARDSSTPEQSSSLPVHE